MFKLRTIHQEGKHYAMIKRGEPHLFNKKITKDHKTEIDLCEDLTNQGFNLKEMKAKSRGNNKLLVTDWS